MFAVSEAGRSCIKSTCSSSSSSACEACWAFCSHRCGPRWSPVLLRPTWEEVVRVAVYVWCCASSALGACLLSLQSWDIDGLPSVCSETWCSSLCIFRQCQGFQGYARFVDEAVWTCESWVDMDSSWFSLVGRMVGATGKISENCPPEVCWCKFVDPHRTCDSVGRDRGLYQFQALDFCWRWHRGQRAFDTCAFSAWAQWGLLQSSLWGKLSLPWEFGSEMAALPECSSAVLVRMVDGIYS